MLGAGSRGVQLMARSWKAFPHPAKAFDYAGSKLEKAWAELHLGDQEPFPDEARLALLMAAGGKAGKAKPTPKAVESLQEAWRAFHRGDFQQAVEMGESLGAAGATVANKAEGIYAVYLVEDEKARLKHFMNCVERAEAAMVALPEDANAHYFRAFALGRYSQGISITKALSQGLAGKVKESLDKVLKLSPKHAEAHTALGLYHAEIIDKVGAMIGGLTYGAKAATASEHLDKALKLTPKAPIAWIEYGNGLLMLHGDKKLAEAEKAYAKAAAIKPIDAMQALDVAYASEQLED
jgi:tetratricopeptide (TPR) repeat protein